MRKMKDIKKVVDKFLSKKGIRYIVLLEPPFPDDDPLYIEYQNGVIKSAGSSAGTISIFDAERELNRALAMAVGFKTRKEEIEGKVRPVLYIYYQYLEKEISTPLRVSDTDKKFQDEVVELKFRGKGIRVRAAGFFLEVSTKKDAFGNWDTCRIDLNPGSQNVETPWFLQSKENAEKATLDEVVDYYINVLKDSIKSVTEVPE